MVLIWGWRCYLTQTVSSVVTTTTLWLPHVKGADGATAGVLSKGKGGQITLLNLLNTKNGDVSFKAQPDRGSEFVKDGTQTLRMPPAGQRLAEKLHPPQLVYHRRRKEKIKWTISSPAKIFFICAAVWNVWLILGPSNFFKPTLVWSCVTLHCQALGALNHFSDCFTSTGKITRN